MAFAPGSRLGAYEVIAPPGEGELDRDVAAIADAPASTIDDGTARLWRSTPAHMPQLDAIRAFAILGVMLWHLWGPPFGLLGGIGVQLFFVLSGFLITGILLRARAAVAAGTRPASFVLRRFYLRRILRIFPLYYLTLAVCWAAHVPTAGRGEFVWHAAYLSDFYFAAIGDYASALAHFWTLAVEEQFYLVWPFVVVFMPTRFLLPFLILTAMVGPEYRGLGALAGLDAGVHWMWMDTAPFASLDSLALGGIVAYGWTVDLPGSEPIRTTLVTAAGWIGATFLLFAWLGDVLDVRLGAWRAAFGNTAWAMLFAWLIDRAAHGIGGITGCLLQLRGLRYLGRISYGLYVFHPLMEYAVRWALGHMGLQYPPNHLASALLLFAVTIGLASVSWQIYERPLNNLKENISYA